MMKEKKSSYFTATWKMLAAVTLEERYETSVMIL